MFARSSTGIVSRTTHGENSPRALIIIAAALAIYWPALSGTWLWDDNILVTSNAHLRTLPGLAGIWFSPPVTDYWPLTWSLLWLEWHLWGDAPLGYHIVSLALHISSGLLLWRILARLGLRHAWLGGLLFVIHPLAVESVAWISEIKNTLSLPLFLLAFDAWLDAENGKSKSSAYARSIAFYLLAMLAKTSTVMLPLVLALYCWWKRGRITPRELLRLAPYFVIALVLGLVTIHFQNHDVHEAQVEPTGFIARLLIAGTALCFYSGKFILPLNLLPIYPPWSLDPPSLLQILTIPALIALVTLLWLAHKTWTRHALFGFGFFLITALPVLGFVPMEFLHFSPVADHLIYLPMLGLIGLVVALIDLVSARIPASFHPAAGVLAIAIAGLAWLSHNHARLYANPETLWAYTIDHNPNAWPAWNGLGTVLMDSGRVEDSILLFEQALRLKPDDAQAHYNLGNAQFRLGHVSEAIAEYQLALQFAPHDAQAQYNIGNALLQAGRLPEAIEQYQHALVSLPDSTEVHDNLGVALARSGRTADAIAQFQLALQLNPADADAQANLARLHAQPKSP